MLYLYMVYHLSTLYTYYVIRSVKTFSSVDHENDGTKQHTFPTNYIPRYFYIIHTCTEHHYRFIKIRPPDGETERTKVAIYDLNEL